MLDRCHSGLSYAVTVVAMDGAALAVAAFVVGTACNAVKAIPQFIRTAVRGRVAGLSVTAVWLALTAQILWLCFGLAIRDWRFAVLGVVQTTLTVATVARFVGRTGWRHNAGRAVAAVGACVVFGSLAATGRGLVLESLGAALGVIIGAPQLAYLWRRRKSSVDVTGVAQGEYIVVITAQVAWTTYWLLEGHPLAAIGAAWGGTARFVTLGLLRGQVARARGGTPSCELPSDEPPGSRPAEGVWRD